MGAFVSRHKRNDGAYHDNRASVMSGVHGTLENCKASTSEFSATSARDVTTSAVSDSVTRNRGFKNDNPIDDTLVVMECTESITGMQPRHAAINSRVVALRCASNAGVCT